MSSMWSGGWASLASCDELSGSSSDELHGVHSDPDRCLGPSVMDTRDSCVGATDLAGRQAFADLVADGRGWSVDVVGGWLGNVVVIGVGGCVGCDRLGWCAVMVWL